MTIIRKSERTGEGSDVLKRGSLRGSGGNDDGVLHGVVLLKGLDELGNGGSLLTNSNVDAVKLLSLVGSLGCLSAFSASQEKHCTDLVPPVLVKHGVEGDSGLSGLTVTNNQLTLTTSDRNHGVDRLETGLYGLVDGLAGQDTGGLELGTATLGGLEGTLSIDGVTESVNDTSEKSLADGDIDLVLLEFGYAASSQMSTYNLSGTLDGLALLDQTVRTEEHNTDLTGFQVHAHALDTGGEPAIR
jgi:hypothetical protein